MCFGWMPGFSQGVRRSVGGLATILGPLWAGGLTENMYIMLGVIMALLLLLTVHIQRFPDSVVVGLFHMHVVLFIASFVFPLFSCNEV